MNATFLDPQLLAATKRLTLRARRLVAGAVAGEHPSRRPGVSREFSQYRPYQPGDEPRHIDWKLFARSDRYFLRESEIETRVSVSVILDATASMQHVDAGSDPVMKFDRARAVAAALALLAENQGDAMTLHAVSNGEVISTSAAHDRQPFHKIVHALSRCTPAGRWPEDARRLTQELRRTGADSALTPPGTTARLTVVLTDGHEHGGEIRASLAPLRARQHELLLLHFIGRDERDFPFRGPVRFEEWETGRVIEADATTVRSAYFLAEQQERDAWKRTWGGTHFDYLPLMTDEPLERGLRAYLRRRAGR